MTPVLVIKILTNALIAMSIRAFDSAEGKTHFGSIKVLIAPVVPE